MMSGRMDRGQMYNWSNGYIDTDMYDPEKVYPVALNNIREALAGESEDRAFYEYLISQAPTGADSEVITGIRNDEIRHYSLFRQLYLELTGKNLPETQAEPFMRPESYCDGLRRALMGEQGAVIKYRTILFAMQDRKHINIVTSIVTDELRHLGLYNYLYSKNSCDA
jgi:rubrerythrin